MKNLFLTMTAAFTLFASLPTLAGHCAPQNRYDSTAVAVCNTQFSNIGGCQAQGYFCYWVDGGSCVANNPNDQTAIAVCSTQNSSQVGCQAQGYFCHWIP